MNDKSQQPIPPETEQPKRCPFNHTNCIGDKCALWVSISGNVIAGGKQQRVSQSMCAFQALLTLQVQSLNKPQSHLQGLTIPGMRGG